MRQKISMLTAYDRKTAKLLEKAKIDIILVGDSYGMVVLGYENTKKVSLEQMIKITKDVKKGAPTSFIIFDMPYKSYETKEQALNNAKKVLKETKCQAIKIEGHPKIVQFLTQHKIKVMGHTGLKPQFVNKFVIKGKTQQSAEKIYLEAKNLEKAGAFAIVLECIPEILAKKITENLKIPTIGIGAGKFTDGQVLVTHDLLGWKGGRKLSFVEKVEGETDLEKIKNFIKKVKKS